MKTTNRTNKKKYNKPNKTKKLPNAEQLKIREGRRITPRDIRFSRERQRQESQSSFTLYFSLLSLISRSL